MWLEIAQSTTESGSSLGRFWVLFWAPFQTGQNRSTKIDKSEARGIFGFYLFLRSLSYARFVFDFCQIAAFNHWTCHIFHAAAGTFTKSIKPAAVAAANSIAVAFEVAIADDYVADQDFAITRTSRYSGAF